MAWDFVQAGTITVPPAWVNATVTWSFDGQVDAWYSGQASLGTSNCYLAVAPAPTYGDYTTQASSQCAVQPSTTPYAVGMWLWGNAAVMGGTWTLVVEYSLAPAPPPPPPLPLPPPASPARPPPSPAASAALAWTPVGGSECTAAGLATLSCDAGVPAAGLSLPASQLASAPLPGMGGVPTYAGVFMLQAQTYTRRGFPAVLAAMDDTTHVLWRTDLPNTPSGDACQDGGDACPNGGGLAQPSRPTAAAALLPAAAAKLVAGFAPAALNSWGAAGGAGCDAAGTCAQYGPVVALTLADTRVLLAAQPPPPSSSPGVDVLLPVAWVGHWASADTGHASGDRGAVALMVDACGSADASADLGWTAGGNASVVAAAAWDGAAAAVGLDATLSVGASWSVAVPLGGSALVPAGPLTLTVRAAGTSGCAGVAWRRVLVSGIAVKLAYAPPPPAFVVKRAIGSCMRGMQPLTV